MRRTDPQTRRPTVPRRGPYGVDSHKEDQYSHAFTVFTATYNRAHVLHRVYDSLRAQTFRDFEWLVVDDGSTDGARALVEAWRDEFDFPIRYFHQENRGKHAAYNHAVPKARGRFFLTLDSDDSCVPHALERLNHYSSQVQTRFVNDPLRIYHTESDSITAAPAAGRNAYSYLLGSCLRSYRNQFAHQHLNRKRALEILERVRRPAGDPPV